MAKKTKAYIAPFFIFILFLGISGGLESGHVTIGGVAPMYWIYPLQTVACGAALAFFWRSYGLEMPRKGLLAAGIGVLVFGIWVAPATLLRRPEGVEGFDPEIFAGRPVLYWGEAGMRFARLVVVVPLLEEIFWRGFVLRYLIDERFERVPFGSYSRLANLGVALGFMLEHSMRDWPAAAIAGLLYNLTAYRTRSLSSCVIAHGITNALLGAYIMMTGQWGFW